MQSIFIGILLVSLVSARPQVDNTWGRWKDLYGRRYHTSHDEIHRRAIWDENVAIIKDHNLKYDLGIVSYKMGLNKFSDLSWKEFRQTYLLHGFSSKEMLSMQTKYSKPLPRAPAKWDWREYGVVTPVKDQGTCKSSWAFSITGAFEGQYIQHIGYDEFSAQHLVDCTMEYGNNGCTWGSTWLTYNFTRDVGLKSEKDYPYVGKQQTCQDKGKLKVRSNGIWMSVGGDEEWMKELVRYHGPASAVIHADPNLQHYRAGVFASDTCKEENAFQSGLVVGYGDEQDEDYWIMKNSWGTQWGEEGYIRIARNRNDMCGIASSASLPDIKND